MNILIRTDASLQIGTGHLMRCLALAQECRKRGHTPLFVLAMDTPLIERIKNEGMEVVRIDAERGGADDAEKTINIAHDHEVQWIITDGYAFDVMYGSALRSAGHPVLMIDDYAHLPAYECDLLLNQNIDATEMMYAGKADASLLLGTRYALLRKEFLQHTNRMRVIPKIATNILVSLGGSDPQNATALVLKALDFITETKLKVNLIVGGENPHTGELRETAAHSPHTITFLQNVTDMPSPMAEADLAISAAGSTSWELLSMGLPFITGILAENQVGIARELGNRNLAVNVGWYREITEASLGEKILALLRNPEARRKMSERGKKTVDGRGAERVVEAMLSYSV